MRAAVEKGRGPHALQFAALTADALSPSPCPLPEGEGERSTPTGIKLSDWSLATDGRFWERTRSPARTLEAPAGKMPALPEARHAIIGWRTNPSPFGVGGLSL